MVAPDLVYQLKCLGGFGFSRWLEQASWSGLDLSTSMMALQIFNASIPVAAERGTRISFMEDPWIESFT
jgi:hypothetical protein